MFGSDRESDGNVIFERGTISFFGRILGEDAQVTGHFTGECTRPERGRPFTCTEEHVWHLEDGRLLKLTVTFLTGDDFPIRYTGILLDPPGLRLGVTQRRGR